MHTDVDAFSYVFSFLEDLLGLYVFFSGCQHMSNTSAPDDILSIILTAK